MSNYVPVPVEAAKAIATRFEKDAVVILCWDNKHQKTHTTTYGTNPLLKVNAARIGEDCCRLMGCNMDKMEPSEDFRREYDAALIAQLKEVCQAAMDALKSYQFGNSSSELAAEVVLKLDTALAAMTKGVPS
jgi:hypothetical protein